LHQQLYHGCPQRRHGQEEAESCPSLEKAKMNAVFGSNKLAILVQTLGNVQAPLLRFVADLLYKKLLMIDDL